MRLFDKFKKTVAEEQPLTERFNQWLDSVLEKDIPNEVVAFNFNIYEDPDMRWSVEVVGTSFFDENNDDWACNEVTEFGTREKPFSWQEDTTWEEVLFKVKNQVSKYLEEGKYSWKLEDKKAVACGFVDGDLVILHKDVNSH